MQWFLDPKMPSSQNRKVTTLVVPMLVATAISATPACADMEYGTFGAWEVYSRTSADGSTYCSMMETGAGDVSAIFMVGPSEPGSAVVSFVDLKGFSGLSDGQRTQVLSTFNAVQHVSTTYTVTNSAHAMTILAPLTELRTLAGLQSWQIDVPELHVEGVVVPLTGFPDAVNALAGCGAAIGAPF